MGGMVIIKMARSQRLRKDFASVYTPQNDAFSFLTNFFPVQGNQPVYSSLAQQSVFPFCTRALVRPFTGYLPRIKEGLSSGDVAASSARKSGDAMATSSASG